MIFSNALIEKAEKLLEACRQAGLHLVTAESCTGGLISACLTEISGSSDVVERGFVTYSNEAKIESLGVPADLLRAHGAVSREVAAAMAEGALAHSAADLAVSVTGIAGPTGATERKPVGLVYTACACRGGDTRVAQDTFPGGRADVRLAATERAIDMLLETARQRR